MRTLVVAATSAVGMGLVSTADVSAQPANAGYIRDGIDMPPAAVMPARYYYVYRYRYYRPVYVPVDVSVYVPVYVHRYHVYHYWYYHRY
jgi:hypothetical protein